MTMFSHLLEKLLRREDLTTDEASAAMNVIMDGAAQASQIAGLLIALAMKGERPAEVVGFAQTMRERATKLSQDYRPVFDTCGTGGDRAHTFNVSTVAALVLAACGVRVAKHGNRSVSSRCGSADLFEALGVNVAAEPAVVERCLAEAGIAFFFAPTFHPSMRHAGPARKELGVRTAFNLLGPLTNPAGAARQLVGVPRPELTELVARSLALLGSERAWVVHGADGLDEISTGGYTKVSECRDGEVNTFYLHPTDIGLSKSAPDALRGGDAADNAAIARRVLAGEPGPQRDVVLLNTAAALLIAGRIDRIRDGLAMAAEAVDSGRAAAVLERLTQLSTGTGAAADQSSGDGALPLSRTADDPDHLRRPARNDRRRDRTDRRGACPRGVDQRAGTALGCWPAAAGRGVRTSAARVAGTACHCRMQTPLTVARHPQARLRPGRARARLRGGRRRGDLGAHRADLL